MMQDSVLTLCKDSVMNFVLEIMKFIPESTEVVSTSAVKNTYKII